MPIANETVIDPAVAVAAGVTWLDEHQPGWAGRINLGALELNSSNDCVACQVAGIANVGRALAALGVDDGWANKQARALGFWGPTWRDAPGWPEFVDSWYKAAEALWRTEIMARQGRKG